MRHIGKKFGFRTHSQLRLPCRIAKGISKPERKNKRLEKEEKDIAGADHQFCNRNELKIVQVQEQEQYKSHSSAQKGKVGPVSPVYIRGNKNKKGISQVKEYHDQVERYQSAEKMNGGGED